MNKTRCVQCGKEIEYYGFCCPTMCDECNREWLKNFAVPRTDVPPQNVQFIDLRDYSVGEPCLICEEMVPTYGYEARHKVYKVCDKCKQAVMQVRGQIEEYERTGGHCLD
jgi:hypothetical protein